MKTKKIRPNLSVEDLDRTTKTSDLCDIHSDKLRVAESIGIKI